MNTLMTHNSVRCGVLLALFSLVSATTKVAAADSKPTVQNIRFEQSDGRILISYDLLAPQDEEYLVSVTVKRQSDSSFHYVPKLVKGAVGSGCTAGVGKVIEWGVGSEFPLGIASDDLIFLVQAEREEGGMGTYLWIGAGAVVGGGLAWWLLRPHDEAAEEVIPRRVGFPSPGGRP